MSSIFEWSTSSLSLDWRSASGVEIVGQESRYADSNLLSFLATVQALRLEFLPVTWETEQHTLGSGATAKIGEAQANAYTSLALKRVHARNAREKSEESIFYTLINEITILGNLSVKYHPNLVELEGYSWDTSGGDRPWPVLVFEKSQFGDLYHFALIPVGQEMDISQRLKLCVDVARAIHDMHSLGIIHGDIKPNNVLIFDGDEGEDALYRASVADFGYSSQYADDDSVLRLPISAPWNAPEHDRLAREWTPADSRSLDAFSLGLLCFWLLFEPQIGKDKSAESHTDLMDMDAFDAGEATLGALATMKAEGKLSSCSRQLLSQDSCLDVQSRTAVERFLASSLSHDPVNRQGSIEAFLIAMDPKRASEKGSLNKQPSPIPLQQGSPSHDFKLEHSLQDFYRSDFRVRSHIAQCLIKEHAHSNLLAAEVALAYYIGFGVERSESTALKIITSVGSDIQSVEDALRRCVQERSVSRSATTQSLIEIGHIRWTDYAHVYLEHGILEEAENQLLREREDIAQAFGDNAGMKIISRRMLSGIYRVQGRWMEAECSDEEVLDVQLSTLGDRHEDTLTAMVDLSENYLVQGRWKDAVALLVKALEVAPEALGEGHIVTLQCMANLAWAYMKQGLLDECIELQSDVVGLRKKLFGPYHPSTLMNMNELALMLLEGGRSDQAEELQTQVLGDSQRIMGPNDPISIDSMVNIANIFYAQERTDEAEDMERRALETSSKTLGENNPRTIALMANLANTLWARDKHQEAESLELRAFEASSKIRGTNHPVTGLIAANLAFSYGEQARWEECEKMGRIAVEVHKKAQGNDYLDLAKLMINLAVAIQQQGRLQEAKEVYHAAQEVVRESFTPGNEEGEKLRDAIVSALERID